MRHGSGVDFIEQDWDNLVVLNACRLDYFREHNTIDGELQRTVSKGSTSWQPVDGKFAGKQLHDTVYVTANPFVERVDDQLGGKSVVTADHGEMLGERLIVSKQYGNGAMFAPELRFVPWLVVDSGDRRDVTADSPEGFVRMDEQERESHLSALGNI